MLRVSQLANEIVRRPDSPSLRITQAAIEILSTPETRFARVAQCAIEVLRENVSPVSDTQPVVIIVLFYLFF